MPGPCKECPQWTRDNGGGFGHCDEWNLDTFELMSCPDNDGRPRLKALKPLGPCKDCRFCAHQGTQSGLEPKDWYECRTKAPILSEEFEHSVFGYWPQVQPDGWCGQFEPRGTKTAKELRTCAQKRRAR